VSRELPGIVLAAGASTRMGRPKLLLPVEPGGTLLGRLLGTLADAGVWPLVVVVRRTLAMESAWRDPRAPSVGVVVNPDPSRGQLSSMLCGLDSFGDRPDAVLQAQVDVPLIRVETVRALVDAWHAARPPLVRPVFHGRTGHPVIFGGGLLDVLRTTDLRGGAKPVVRCFAPLGVEVAVDDPLILEDIDTPEDYRRVVGMTNDD
jgi:molybdenum cofactor cytidylyltransferase